MDGPVLPGVCMTARSTSWQHISHLSGAENAPADHTSPMAPAGTTPRLPLLLSHLCTKQSHWGYNRRPSLPIGAKECPHCTTPIAPVCARRKQPHYRDATGTTPHVTNSTVTFGCSQSNLVNRHYRLTSLARGCTWGRLIAQGARFKRGPWRCPARPERGAGWGPLRGA